MNKYLFTLLIGLLIASCDSPTSSSPQQPDSQEVIDYTLSQLSKSIEEVSLGSYPIRTKGIGEWELTEPSAWTSGFFPGCLWYAFDLSSDSTFYNNAIKFTEVLEDQQFNTDHHDVGFIIYNSYGHAYNFTGKDSYRQIILQAANSLASRYNKNVGCIQSWNGEFQVIIDNMMNLEILFWAAKNGGGSNLYDMAVSHAKKTIEHHLRSDGSSFHVVHFNPNTGKVTRKRTQQGYADSSSWARGQAWGIYGFTMCYRETNDVAFLNAAIKMADYFIANLPSDNVPYWDFELPEDSDLMYKDASAATIALSAFLELRNYVSSDKYNDVVNKIFNSLVNNYLSKGTSSSGIINHCAYNVNSSNPFDWDASTIWGDYYFLESLKRMKESSNY